MKQIPAFINSVEEAENTTYIYLTVKYHFVHHKFNVHRPETEPGPTILLLKKENACYPL